ncbi:EamA family transporter [Aestuariimicrobium ganziense]|uniref:EamA family transporter n=1 Tax=Aestuariimicrobium ganziense TaxID=2773677 RepID=UPI002E2A15FD|nr:EamA family transporter [Aestuariimicrobium ganziense]
MNRAVWPVLIAIVSVQVGAAAAKNLVGTVPPVTMTWLRLAFAALILWGFARPTLRGRTGAQWRLALLYAAGMVGMNWMIYESFSRIPLGIAVTLEFLGPLTLAVLGSRRLLDLLWVSLAAGGVALLGLGGSIDNWIGVACALGAGACWALYIVMGSRIGSSWQGLSVITLACTLGALVFAVPGVWAAGSALLDWRVLGTGALVAVMSTIVPYSLELIALRSIPPGIFGILMSLEPAAAALAALVVLRELLGVTDWVAIGFVVIASWGATTFARRASSPTATA